MEKVFITIGVGLFILWIIKSQRNLRKYSSYCMNMYRRENARRAKTEVEQFAIACKKMSEAIQKGAFNISAFRGAFVGTKLDPEYYKLAKEKLDKMGQSGSVKDGLPYEDLIDLSGFANIDGDISPPKTDPIISPIKELMSLCKSSLMIQYNPHRDYYQSVEVFVEDSKDDIDPEVLKTMIETDTVIWVQAYPNTPVGFYVDYHYDLDTAIKNVLEAVKSNA